MFVCLYFFFLSSVQPIQPRLCCICSSAGSRPAATSSGPDDVQPARCTKPLWSGPWDAPATSGKGWRMGVKFLLVQSTEWKNLFYVCPWKFINVLFFFSTNLIVISAQISSASRLCVFTCFAISYSWTLLFHYKI